MWKTISSGKGWHGEICNRKKDGTLYWFDMINSFYSVRRFWTAIRQLPAKCGWGESLNDLLHRAVEDREPAPNAVVDGKGQEATAPRKKARREPGKPFLQHLGDRWLKVHERRSPAGFKVEVRTDVTELKRAESRIKIQAETDPLTGFPTDAD